MSSPHAPPSMQVQPLPAMLGPPPYLGDPLAPPPMMGSHFGSHGIGGPPPQLMPPPMLSGPPALRPGQPFAAEPVHAHFPPLCAGLRPLDDTLHGRPAGPPSGLPLGGPLSMPMAGTMPSTGMVFLPGLPGVPGGGGLAVPPGGLHDSQGGVSGTSADGNMGFVVPIEYANAKMWGITSEYENLLNIQRDQHMLALRQKEAEAAHLARVVETFHKQGLSDDESCVFARIRAKEEAIGTAIDAKQKELELFASLLQMRDRQIGDLQHMCETKQAQIHQLQSSIPEPAAATPAAMSLSGTQSSWEHQPPLRFPLEPASAVDARFFGRANCVRGSSEDFEDLRREKFELEQMLLAKDKQLNAIQALDPQMKDTSALQLGAQAIQMFHDSLRLKAETAGCGEENGRLQDEVTRLRGTVQELDSAMSQKRLEVKDLTGNLAAKMQKVLELEAEVDAAHDARAQGAEDTKAQLQALQLRAAQHQEDSGSHHQFAQELQRELEERGQCISRQQTELMQARLGARRFEKRAEDLSNQLARNEQALEQMMRNNSQKDKLLRDMTEQVKISETKLHAQQLEEFLGARQCPGQRKMEMDHQDGFQQFDRTPAPKLKAGALERLRPDFTGSTKSRTPMTMWDLEADPSTLDACVAESAADGESLDGIGGAAPLPSRSREVSRLGGGHPETSVDVGSCFVMDSMVLTPCPAPKAIRPSSLRASSASGVSSRSASPRLRCDQQEYGIRPPRPASGMEPPPATQSQRQRREWQDFDTHCASASSGTMPGEGRGVDGSDGVFPDSARVVSVRKVSDTEDAIAPRPVWGAPNIVASSVPFYAQSYRPHPGDPIDFCVADFVNQPENGFCKALFCRLSEGSYLYGTHRASIRTNPETQLLQVFEDDEWISIDDFVARQTGSQALHFPCARKVAGGGGSL